MTVFLMIVVHSIASAWIRIGYEVEGSWKDVHGQNEDYKDSRTNIYIAALYWTVTTLTTVGYGDFKGYTWEEYLFLIMVEFIGLGFFAFFMGEI